MLLSVAEMGKIRSGTSSSALADSLVIDRRSWATRQEQHQNLLFRLEAHDDTNFLVKTLA